MKKIALVLSVLASALVLASCASQGVKDQSTTTTSSADSTVQTSAGHQHHDYKGEMK